jgi:hypothetical protein
MPTQDAAPDIEIRFEVTLSRYFLRRSHSRRIFRNWWQLVIAAGLVFTLSNLAIANFRVGNISEGWGAVLRFIAFFCGFAWDRMARPIDRWARQQGGAPVRYVLTAECVETTSELGSTRIKWTAFETLIVSDFDVILETSVANALTVPTAQIPPAALDYLRQQFEAQGKKVKDRRKAARPTSVRQT